jgi:hypothetical protein
MQRGGHSRTERLLGTRPAPVLVALRCANMATFVYRCPNTGMNVQGWVAEDPTINGETYQPIVCTICARLHLVNPKNGKVLGG